MDKVTEISLKNVLSGKSFLLEEINSEATDDIADFRKAHPDDNTSKEWKALISYAVLLSSDDLMEKLGESHNSTYKERLKQIVARLKLDDQMKLIESFGNLMQSFLSRRKLEQSGASASIQNTSSPPTLATPSNTAPALSEAKSKI